MKTMMKWFVGISCAVAFFAIAFTPSSAAAQYACRPVSRIGPQSIEGPMTLTCSSCVGGNAITIPSGSKLCLDGATCSKSLYYDSSFTTPRIDGNLYVPGTIYSGTGAALRGTIANDGSSNGGSLAFNDATRWLSTMTALLESNTTATTGTDTAFTLNAINAGAPDVILDLQVGGVSKAKISNNGSANFGDGYVLANGGFMSTGVPIVLRSAVANEATAIALKVGNYNALTTAGSKIASFYSDMFTTERAYFDYLGGLHFVTTKWEDLRVPLIMAKPGATKAPDFSKFKDNGGDPVSTGVFAYHFDAAAIEEVFFSVQLPHSYKEGTALKPHVHYAPTTTDTGSVVLDLECTVAAIDGTFANTSTITVTDAADGTAYKHQLASFTDISGSGLGISSMLTCRLARVGSDTNDTYTADIAILEVDFHYEIDSVGSSTSSAK